MSRKLLALSAAALMACSSVAYGQSTTPISQLPAASTPLAGSELVPCVQGGVTKNCLASNLGKVGGLVPTISTIGVQGTATNDNVQAGSVGEYQTNTTSGTSLSNGVTSNATSVALTAGDWDVQCDFGFFPNSSPATTMSAFSGGVSTTSATINFTVGFYFALNTSFTAGQPAVFSTPVVRMSLAAPTTVYCPAQAFFATSTLTVTGYVRARRAR